MSNDQEFLTDVRSTLRFIIDRLPPQGEHETPAEYNTRKEVAAREADRLFRRAERLHNAGAFNITDIVATPRPVESDPFGDVPGFVNVGAGNPPREDRRAANAFAPAHVILHLGIVDNHRVWIISPGGMGKGRENSAMFRWGCRYIGSEVEARSHWHNNVSQRSDAARPHAQALINWVAAICRHRGWPW